MAQTSLLIFSAIAIAIHVGKGAPDRCSGQLILECISSGQLNCQNEIETDIASPKEQIAASHRT